MFSVIRLVDTTPGADTDGLLAALRDAASGATRSVIAPTLPGSRNGGDILVQLRYRDRGHWDRAATHFDELLTGPAVSHVNGATYTGSPTRTEPTGTGPTGTVYRTLLLRVLPDTDADTVDRFEADLRLLTGYVTPITGWQLSRVETALGSSPWTHVFEQEFTDLSGLTGPYLMHPIHWAYVDRWFDPECPEVIIRDRVCHSYCRL